MADDDSVWTTDTEANTPRASKPSSAKSEDAEQGLFYDVSALPLELPCDAPSYLVQTAEATPEGPAPIGVANVMFKTDIVMDLAKAFFAIFTALFAMYTAAFTAAFNSSSMGFLALVAMAYPLVMMAVLMTRANEISLRKEFYYLLMKYQVLVDWENWGWEWSAANTIWIRSVFFHFWVITSAMLVGYVCTHGDAYYEELDSGEGLSKVGFGKGAIAAMVVILQVFLLMGYFVGTLKLEEKGLITLNKFLEDRQGVLDAENANSYLGSGLGGIHVVDELALRDWAVSLYSYMPWPHIPFLNEKTEEQCRAELAEWQAAVEGDLMLLHLEHELHVMGPTNPIMTWVYRRIYGWCLLRVVGSHPDFEAMHTPIRWLRRWHECKVIFSVLVCIGLEAYAVWLLTSEIMTNLP